jgi:hypothetical protein
MRLETLMALITSKRAQHSRSLLAKDIPVAATHVAWFYWGEGSSAGVTVVQYADTERSAKIAYGKAERYIGDSYVNGKVTEAGWSVIEPTDRVNGKVL